MHVLTRTKHQLRIFAFAILALPALPSSAQEPCMMGEVRWFAGTYPPVGWSFAHGQLMTVSHQPALFSIMGTAHGGNGYSNFALPDLRGRMVVGAGQGAGLQNVTHGQKAGTETVTITEANMPAHAHDIDAMRGRLITSGSAASSELPENRVLADTQRAAIYTEMPAEQDQMPMASGSVLMDATETRIVGDGEPVSVRNPYTALHPIICIDGYYPSRP